MTLKLSHPVTAGMAAAVAVLAACGSLAPGQHHAATACDEYRATIAGRSPEEQRAAAEAHIIRMHGSADSQHVERHLRMMQQRCGSPPAGQR
jgi:hypothetical protein